MTEALGAEGSAGVADGAVAPFRSMHVAAVAAPVRQQVSMKLREAILNRTFRPGQRLLERELCEMTGVSRTPVREALRQLEAEGLVTMVPNRGPIVRTVSAREAADLYEVRGVLEALASRLFTERAHDQGIEELHAIVREIEVAGRAGRGGELLALKERFYGVLLRGAANELVTSSLDSLRARVTFLRGMSLQRGGRWQSTVEELDVIVAAMRRRDADAAAQACLEHVRRAAAVALQVLDEEAAG